VRKWPVVGRVAESVGTIFIDRTPAALRQSHGQVASALNEGYNVVLFPESTTTRGDNVQPFKRGLLSVVFNNLSGIPLKKDIHVHPVSLHVTHIDGKPVDSEPELRQKYTWVGGENILIHAWNLARLKSVDVEITVHNAVNPANFSNARHYTEAVHQAVASCLPPFKTSGSAHPQAGP
jgi:1-acyl-sn-glycerol-3-phosphate acyltransferase